MEDLSRKNAKLFKSLISAAWIAAAISSAAPANAVAITTQTGTFANCNDGSYDPWSGSVCNYMKNYLQTIKFVSTPCSTGMCSEGVGSTYVEFIYGVGRHPATWIGGCSGYNFYQLGDCNC